MVGVAGSMGVEAAFTAASVAASEAAGLANFIGGSAAFTGAALEQRRLPAHIFMVGAAVPSRGIVAARGIRRPRTGISSRIRLATTRMSPNATRPGSRFLPADGQVIVLPPPLKR